MGYLLVLAGIFASGIGVTLICLGVIWVVTGINAI